MRSHQIDGFFKIHNNSNHTRSTLETLIIILVLAVVIVLRQHNTKHYIRSKAGFHRLILIQLDSTNAKKFTVKRGLGKFKSNALWYPISWWHYRQSSLWRTPLSSDLATVGCPVLSWLGLARPFHSNFPAIDCSPRGPWVRRSTFELR